MKLSKTILQAMLVAVTVGAISSSCEKPAVDKAKKATTEKTQTETVPDCCPACGMG